ncbi:MULTISPECIES: MobF family relaxase [Sphingobium]|mgnify:CR=1 FL=1|uniref:AAA family ATPase n=1 Tax=Sphingobium baderi TaxID=1332080 RepID=A0A0S3F5F1_9SPHN|nr:MULTISPECIES: MobF family relaxase [Sphingobium]ALR22862.1 AAA family ATPase [Sphingobium baderi]PHP21562.1 AAA family ATPase [Sphingobium sp. IP1]
MHSIASVRSAGGAAKYFTNDDFVAGDYYTSEQAGDVSQWGGEGLKDTPIAEGSAVTREAFEKVLLGETPTGEQIEAKENRRPGYDLTFSAPKSVSVMAYIAGDKRILGPEGAHINAVQKTMAWVEKNLAEGRKTADGKTVPVKTGNLVYALFQHDTSRALDPQAHIHAIVANMTRMPDGKWQALHADRIWGNNSVIGSIYHAFLRNEMEKLGYKVELQGKHGTFELSGVPKKVIEVFSQRRADIVATAQNLGIKSTQGLREVTARTRDPKLNVEDRDGLIKGWIDKAQELGFTGKDVLATALRVSASPQQDTMIGRSYQAMVEVVKSAREFVSGLLRSPDPLVDKGIARIVQSPAEARAQIAVASAIRHLGQREAAFDIGKVAKTALDFGLKGVTIDEVSARVDRLVAKGQLIPGEIRVSGRVEQAVTTPEALATEQAILDRMEAGKGTAEAMIAPASAPDRVQAASPHQLNEGQLAAATMIVSSTDRYVVVQGVAGAGKSTMLQAVTTVAQEEGRKVLGLAFQNKMVADMREGMVPREMTVETMKEAGLEAQTIASFIWQNQQYLADPTGAAAQQRRDELKDTTIVVDETSMVSSADMLKLLEISEGLGIDKLAMVGDRQQLMPIDWGKAFAMVQAAGATMERMDENIRQRTDQLRTVAALANVGKASQALKVLGDKVIENDRPAEHAAETWLALPKDERDVTAVFASGRETRATINQEIQQGLVSEGTLKGGGMDVTIYDRVSKTREELRYAQNYTVGQSLHVTGRVDEIGLGRGVYEVSKVYANGKVEVTGENGRRTRFDPQRIDPSITRERLELSTRQSLTIYEGDKIRWTTNDKDRGLLNSAQATIVAIDAGGVIVENAAKEQVTLERGDPMLSRIDLAYSLNMHMAQGITSDKAITVMLSYEHNLSNQRLFNVGVTRVRDDITMIVDDQQKLERQLDHNPGDKTSALEATGKLEIDGPDAKRQAADDALTAALNKSELETAEPIHVEALMNGHDLDDLPAMGASDTDYSKYDADMEKASLAFEADGKDGNQDKDPRHWLEGDGLGVVDQTVDDLRGIPPMPGRDPDQIPGLPEKNLGLDL